MAHYSGVVAQPDMPMFSLQPNPDSKIHEAYMGPPGADMTQVGPMLATWTLLSGKLPLPSQKHNACYSRLPTEVLRCYRGRLGGIWYKDRGNMEVIILDTSNNFTL